MKDPLAAAIVRLVSLGLQPNCEDLAARYNRTPQAVRRLLRDTQDKLARVEHQLALAERAA